MAASVAHEMRNYLAVLSGRTELMRRKFEKDGLTEFATRRRDPLDADRAALDPGSRFARLLAQGDARSRNFDLNALCREMVEFLQPQNAFDKVEFELDLRRGPGEVEGDAGQIHQVVLNLCRNAAEAMAEAGRQEAGSDPDPQIDGKGYVRVEVEDNGPGVPAGHQAADLRTWVHDRRRRTWLRAGDLRPNRGEPQGKDLGRGPSRRRRPVHLDLADG